MTANITTMWNQKISSMQPEETVDFKYKLEDYLN